jgi:hypothetical protein
MSTALVHSTEREITAADFSPIFTIEAALERKKLMNNFIGKVLVEDSDYGKIPGAGDKKVLLKPGAEKLCSIFGLAPRFQPVQVIEDWTGTEHGNEPLFYYEYRCELSRGGRFAGEGIGSCNSWESKYRYRWAPASALPSGIDLATLPSRSSTVVEFAFAIEKGETGGQYGKPAEYWERWRAAIASGEAREVVKETRNGKKMEAWEMGGTSYRMANDQFADVVNTCQKMAQKRALVAAVLVVTNCSDAFSQDVDDFEEEPQARPAAPPNATAQRRIDEETAKLEAQRKAAATAEPPLNIAAMVKGFEALKERLGPHTALYYGLLKNFGVAHSNELRDKDKAKACYREMEALVKKYEAQREKDMDPANATVDADAVLVGAEADFNPKDDYRK